MATLPELEQELKELIVQTLALEDIDPGDIESDQLLFGEGLGLDSVDALELGVALNKRYGLVLDGDSEETREHFATVATLARLVASQQNEQPQSSSEREEAVPSPKPAVG